MVEAGVYAGAVFILGYALIAIITAKHLWEHDTMFEEEVVVDQK